MLVIRKFFAFVFLLLCWIDVMFKSFRFLKKVLKETALDPFCFQRLETIFKKEFFQILFCPLNERERLVREWTYMTRFEAALLQEQGFVS